MNWFDDNVTPLLARPESAGMLGTILGWLGAPGESWRVRAFNFAAGVGSALYAAPLVVKLSDIKATEGKLFLAFVFGMLGMNLVAKTIEYAKDASFFTILARFIPSKKPEADK